ncbi:MAG: GntR family transcriptional regulator [Terracidiphilus sp.]|jgi:DNA-binding transcriptional regulator YhcF (GntR family)
MTQPTTISIDLSSSVPAYRQIVDAMRVQLVEERLKPGQMLPTVRRLAMELGVHFNTVAQAYRELAGEGWLDLKHGRGAMVIQRETPDKGNSSETPNPFGERLRELVAQMRADGVDALRIASELKSFAQELEK